MNQAAMRSLWREWTNERSTTVVPDATIDLYMQGALENLNRRIRFSYGDDTSALTLVTNQQEYAVPSDFVEVVWIELNGQELKKGDVEEWRRKGINWRGATAGYPEEWALYGTRIVLYPKAGQVVNGSTATLRYLRTPPDFTASGPTDLLSQDHRIIVYGAAAEYAGIYPESAVSQARAMALSQRFESEAELIKNFYLERGLVR